MVNICKLTKKTLNENIDTSQAVATKFFLVPCHSISTSTLLPYFDKTLLLVLLTHKIFTIAIPTYKIRTNL